MHHPRNKAERRRAELKRKSKYEHDREGHVAKRLAEEAAEQKEALEQLGILKTLDKQEDAG